MLFSLPLVVEVAALLEGVELTCGALDVGAGLASKAPGMAGAAPLVSARAAPAMLAVLAGMPLARGWKVLDAEILV